GRRLALAAFLIPAATAPATAAAAALAPAFVTLASFAALRALLAVASAAATAPAAGLAGGFLGFFFLFFFFFLVLELLLDEIVLLVDGGRPLRQPRPLGRRRAVRFDAHPGAFEIVVDQHLDQDAVALLDLGDLAAPLVEQIAG